jgi:hypothetical protein
MEDRPPPSPRRLPRSPTRAPRHDGAEAWILSRESEAEIGPAEQDRLCALVLNERAARVEEELGGDSVTLPATPIAGSTFRDPSR